MKSMRQLINLMEGVTAVPGIGTKIDEKSTSEKQARFMAAASHDPAFAKKVGMDTSVAKEFNKADTGTKQLSNAMKHKEEESCMDEGIGEPKPMDSRLASRLKKEVADKKWADHKASDEKDKKEKEVKEECNMEECEISEIANQAMMRFHELMDSFVEPEEAFEIVIRELKDRGIATDADIADSRNAILAMHGGDQEEPAGSFDMSDDAEALASAGFGSDEDYGSFGDNEFEEDAGIDGLFDEEISQPDNTLDYALKSLIDAMQTSQDPEGEISWVAKTHNVSPQALSQAWQEYSAHGAMDEDLNNGYDDINDASGNDYFPSGADSSVVRATGASGARQGDNPEQKKMQVAEVHKELVYGYRNYLRETTGVTDYNPKSQGGTVKELLAKYKKTKSSEDATAARKAGATQNELKAARESSEK